MEADPVNAQQPVTRFHCSFSAERQQLSLDRRRPNTKKMTKKKKKTKKKTKKTKKKTTKKKQKNKDEEEVEDKK